MCFATGSDDFGRRSTPSPYFKDVTTSRRPLRAIPGGEPPSEECAPRQPAVPPPKRPSATASRAGRATAPRLPYLVSQRTQAEGGPALDLSGTDAESNGEVALVVTQEHLRFLFSYLTLLGVRQADLEDLVQDCLCGLYRSRARFARRPQDITNWLAAIARHQVANYRARRRFTNEIPVPIEDLDELPGSAPGADALAIAGSRRKVLDELLGDMPEERMRVLIAKELLHMGFEEIAQQVGCPVSTARKRYRLAMQDLARERARWQARQRRRGLDILPILLAPLLFAKRQPTGHSAVSGNIRTGGSQEEQSQTDLAPHLTGHRPGGR